MVVHWSTSELALVLGLPPGGPMGMRLQAALRDAIRRRALDAGDALPSTRGLAVELGVARGTVVSAYEQLVAEGYLVAQQGGRTRVAPQAATPQDTRSSGSRASAPRFDLRPGVPDLRSFPAHDWVWAYAEAARGTGSADLDYGDGRGHPRAREAVAGHLRRARAAATSPEGVLLCQGFAQALTLVLPALRERGARMLAVEDPGDPTVDTVGDAAGLVVVPVPVDEEGLRVDLLAATGAHAVLVTPAHQSPTGVVLSPGRRRQLVEWAQRAGGWIVEDDYDSEFRYDRQPVGALQGLVPERTVLIGSASKTHAPGVRTAWIAAPRAWMDDLAARRQHADRGGPVLSELAFAALLESGRHDKHVRRMRAVYAARRGILLASLRARRPDLRLTGVSAGFHGVLELPPGADEVAAVEAAAARSVRIVGLSTLIRAGQATRPSLVLGFGDIDDESVPEAIGRLCDAVDDVMHGR